MAIDPLSQRLSDFDLGRKNPTEFDPTKIAGASIEPLISMARQKPDLSEFLSTARASGPRLQSLASRLPDLSGLRALTTGPIEETPSFKAATKAYEAGVEPGVINQMTIRGLGSGTALAGELGRTRASAMLPIIENEQARRDAALRTIAGFEEAGIGRETGVAQSSDAQLLQALLNQAGVEESAITRGAGAAQTGLGQLLNTGLTETGRTFAAGEAEKNRKVQRELADKQLQAVLALAAGQFGAASLPTVLNLLGLGDKASALTPLLEKLGILTPKGTPGTPSAPTPGTPSGPEETNLASLARQALQAGAGSVADLAFRAAVSQVTGTSVEALSGTSTQSLISILSQPSGSPLSFVNNPIDLEDATFGEALRAATNTGGGIQRPIDLIPGRDFSTISEEPLGMLPGSESGDLAGLQGFGALPETPSLPFESAFSGLDLAGPGASSAALEKGGGLDFGQFGLGNLASVLGLGTGIASLVGGKGNTASNVLGDIGTAASGLNLVNTFAPTAVSEAIGLTSIAPFLGPIGIVAGIGGLFAKLFGGGPSKHKLQSPQRRATAASAGLSATQDAGFDLTQDETNLLSQMMKVGGGPPMEQQSTALNVAHLEALRAKGGKRTQGDIAAIQAILKSRGLPTGSVDEIAEAHAIQTIEHSGLSASQQITAINQVKHHFAERKISKEKQLAENAAAQERQGISGGLETAFIDSLGREVFKNDSGETSQLVFRDKEGNFVKWRDPDEGEH